MPKGLGLRTVTLRQKQAMAPFPNIQVSEQSLGSATSAEPLDLAWCEDQEKLMLQLLLFWWWYDDTDLYIYRTVCIVCMMTMMAECSVIG